MASLSHRLVPILAVGAALGLGTTAAEAQSRHDGGYAYGYGSQYRYPADHGSEHRTTYSGWSVSAQRDRPGDYRCDAFWDASRTDCDARWRDQRGRSTSGYSDRRHDRYGYGYGYAGPQPYYGPEHGPHRSDRSGDTRAYYGAYGRPDVVYGSGGTAYGQGRDPYRIEWCRRNYRSYDARSGYYRAYSGRLVYCG